MNQSLDKRLLALEQAQPQGEKVMFIVLVGMGEAGKELAQLHDNHGNHWSRRPEEPEDAFKNRASAETPRGEQQVAVLFGQVANVGH